MAYIGVDLGGTKLASAAFTDRGELLYRESVPLAERRGAAVGSLIADRVREIGGKYGCDGAGVCIPGLYRAARGTVWAPNIPGWDDYPLLDELHSALSSPVTID